MSNTLRKDKYDKIYKEGLKKKDRGYRCRCHYCVGVDRNELVDKISKKETKEQIIIIEAEENYEISKLNRIFV